MLNNEHRKEIYEALQPKPKIALHKPKTQLRIHFLGAAYAVSSKQMICSPFVQRTIKMPEMFMKLGHQVYHYGHEKSEVNCTEHISVTNDGILKASYGDDYDKRKHPPKIYADDDAIKKFHENAEPTLRERIQPDDIVVSLFGWGDRPLCERIEDLPCHVVEASIGYPDSYHTTRVFQSPTKMHFERGRSDAVLKMRAKYPDSEPAKKYREWERLTGNEPDANSIVIPPMSDPRDFEYSENKSDYMLLIGRVDRCKGLDIAIKLAEYTGDKLIIAGPLKEDADGKPIPLKDIASVPIPKNVEYIGIADADMRRELNRDARVCVLPSRFLEPGHNTHIEAALSGTPVLVPFSGITMDYVWQGINGFLCQPDDFADYVEAYERIDEIKHWDCLQYGLNFSLDRLSLFYHEWFHRIIRNAHRDFWEVPPKNTRADLNWLDPKPIYPYPTEKVETKIKQIQNKIEAETGYLDPVSIA